MTATSSAGVAVSASTTARSVARLTCARFTPGCLVSARSTRRTQEAQVMPLMPIVMGAAMRACSLTVLQDFHELFDDALLVAALMGGDDMALEVALQHQVADLVECAVYGLDLLEHVHTIDLLVLEHAQNAFHVAAHRQQ